MKTIPCEYCQEGQIQASSINSHLTICEEYPIQCENKCTYGTVDGGLFIASRKVMRVHLQRECPLQQVTCPYAQHGCDTKFNRNNAQHHIIVYMRKHLKLVENTLKEAQFSLLAKQIDLVLTKHLPLSGGVEWRVLSVKNRIFRNKEFQSPPLYSCGYKFRFSVRFNNKQHLGVYFALLRGENDDELNWPLKGEITFLLVNQTFGSEYDHVERIWSEDYTDQVWFNPPMIDDNPFYLGYPNYISYKDLNACGYIIDDCILLRVILKCL